MDLQLQHCFCSTPLPPATWPPAVPPGCPRNLQESSWLSVRVDHS